MTKKLSLESLKVESFVTDTERLVGGQIALTRITSAVDLTLGGGCHSETRLGDCTIIACTTIGPDPDCEID